MKRRMSLTILISWTAMLAVGQTACGQSGATMNVNVMSFNVWTADAQTAKLAEVIQAGGADVIGVQELDGTANGMSLANALGYRYYNQGIGGNRILSRYAIVGRSTDNRGVKLEITPGHNIWIFNCHLTPYPYGPYDLRDNPNLTEAQLIATANTTRGAETMAFLNSIAASTSANDRVFFTGDFNEPSHLDWTEAAALASPRPFDKKVMWPTSQRVTNAGFTDSFRYLRPDEVNDRGYTWTPGEPPPFFSQGNNEVHDRIDFVYYRGAGVVTTSSNTIGPHNSIYGSSFIPDYHSDIGVIGYNSDHRAVASGFQITGLMGTVLTFAGQPHNLGSSNALNQGNYGDRLITSPNVEVQFSASNGAFWDTYDGNQDSGTYPNNQWEWGVAQLQSPGTNTGAQFDLSFTSDSGYGIVVDSFDLIDFAGFASGHTVQWQLWEGSPLSGILRAGGTEIIAANALHSVMVQYQQSISGTATLRLIHLAGDGSDLAIDNISFQAIPEPGPGLLLMAVATIAGFQRSRKFEAMRLA